MTERRLEHKSGEARAFSAALRALVWVDIEASAHTRWFALTKQEGFKMRKYWSWSAMLFLALSISAYAATNIKFQTFVPSSSIANAEGGNHSAIAFNFAGNKFVGSVYGSGQLYSTDLTGGSVTPFGQPIPGISGEVVMGAALGVNQGSWTPGDIYAGSEGGSQIYHFASTGGTPTLFATLPNCGPNQGGSVRQIFFDPGSSFQGNMLVTTNSGNIFQITHTGSISCLKNLGEDTEGMDIATNAWGPYAGDLLVGSEGSGTIRLVSPSGQVTVVLSVGSFPGAETISFVPLNLDPNDPVQGFYVGNYPKDVQFAPASNFTGLLGDAIVTDEFGGSTAWDVHYDSSTGTFTKTQFTFTGNQISAFEDGIFVSSQREASEPGYLEICKASDPAHPVTGTFTFTATIFGFNSGPIQVPVGDCSGAIQVPSGAVTITERPVLGDLVSNVTAFAYDDLGFYHDELLSWTVPDLHAIVNVMAGDQDEETLATVTNYAAPPGQLKICKIAGPGVPVGTPFTFFVRWGRFQFNFYTVPAGPPAQGGYCTLAGTYPVNTPVLVSEVLVGSPYQVSNITVSPPDRGGSYTSNSVIVTIGDGFTEATFTNVPKRPSMMPANQFTPLASGSVSQIDIAVGYVSGVNSFYASLWTSSGNLPGTQLARWDNLSSSTSFGQCCGLVTISGISGLSLIAGNSYFLVLGPENISSTTFEWWNLNNTGVMGLDLYSTDGGITWNNNGQQTLGAFDVLGVSSTLFSDLGSPGNRYQCCSGWQISGSGAVLSGH